MNKILLFGMFAACCGACNIDALAGWGPRGCAPVEALAAGQTAAGHKWSTLEGRADEAFLYRGALLVGAYDYRTGYYHEIHAGQWGRKARAPITPPLGGLAGDTTGHTFGMTAGHVGQAQSFSISGVASTRDDVEHALGASLRDDSKAGHVTYIDADPIRRKTLADRFETLRASSPTLADVRFQAYDPARPQTKEMLASNKLDTDKQFTSAGRVLVAQAATTRPDGAAQPSAWYGDITEADINAALRKACPDWDPNKAPVPFLPQLPTVPWEWIALALLGVGVVIIAIRSPHN